MRERPASGPQLCLREHWKLRRSSRRPCGEQAHDTHTHTHTQTDGRFLTARVSKSANHMLYSSSLQMDKLSGVVEHASMHMCVCPCLSVYTGLRPRLQQRQQRQSVQQSSLQRLRREQLQSSWPGQRQHSPLSATSHARYVCPCV